MNRTFIFRLLRLSNNWYKAGKVPIVGNQLLSRVSRVGAKITCAVGISTLALPVAHCWGFGSKQESATTSEGKGMDDSKIVGEADTLYKSGEGEKLYALLVAHKDSQNADILWRLARATCDLAKDSKDQKRRAELMNEAFEYVSRALAADPNNFACHKWYGILLNYTSEIKGTKETIVNSFVVKEHFQKAIELNPKDATSIHLLGVWCFSLADLPWYQRKIASAIFATPPKTSYEEALGYFLQAEEADANFYSMNLLMIGKTYVRMGQKDKALPYLQRARDYQAKTPDDKQANTEAVELLKSIGAA